MGGKQAAQGRHSQMLAHLLNAGFQTQAMIVDYKGKIQTRRHLPGSVSKKQNKKTSVIKMTVSWKIMVGKAK